MPTADATLLRDPEELERLAPAWKALEAAIRLPTQTWPWVKAAAETFHAHGGLLMVATNDGRAVAPLARRGRRLGLLGVAELSEPTDLLASDPASLEDLTRAMTRLRRPLRLERVPAESPTVSAIREAGKGRGLVVVRPQAGSPWVQLDETWCEPESQLSSRRRSDLRRARRRAEQEGEVSAEVSAPTISELDRLLEVAWDVEARSWRAARQGAIAQDPLRGPFFRTWARLAAEDGTLRIALLYVGEKAVAMQLAAVVADGYWLLKIGFDEAYKRCSPGMLLIADTLGRAAEAGLRTYELMGVVEPWTHMWTERVRECVSIRTYPLSASGSAALVGDGAQSAWARVRRSSK